MDEDKITQFADANEYYDFIQYLRDTDQEYVYEEFLEHQGLLIEEKK